ncbi:hypothetical protein [Cellulomonas fimi]|uniref:hypothetical protein n=1 Tax=Cellulomonas fimi TaxID=1708 RepID=UPI0023582FBE|nr:hypothetical protein [Cellulomonas fimi]
MAPDDEHVPLTYGERTAWTTAVTVPLGTLGYLVVVVPRALREPVADVAWAGPMLWAMGFTLVASIVGAILLALVTRDHDTSQDVRDTQIERYGDRIALVATAVGAVAVLALAMLEVDWFWIGSTLFLLGAIGTTWGAVAQLRAYRGAFVG